MNDVRTNHHRSATTIDVAVFDGGSHLSTQACRGLGEARTVMNRINAEGYRCLIVSPAMCETLDGGSRRS